MAYLVDQIPEESYYTRVNIYATIIPWPRGGRLRVSFTGNSGGVQKVNVVSGLKGGERGRRG